MSKDIDYTTDLLKRINSIALDGVPISSFFSITIEGQTYSLWSFQQFFLREEIRKFSEHKNFEVFHNDQVKRKLKSYIIDFVFTAIAIFISAIFVLFLVLRKTTVLIYSADKLKKGTRHDPRLWDVYGILKKERVPYAEIIHTLLGDEFIRNIFRRRRTALYLESIDALRPFFRNNDVNRKYYFATERVSLEGFQDFERPFVQYLMREYSKRCLMSEFRIFALERILKRSGLKTFISIDDIRHTNELIFAAQLAGIKTYVFQHSNFDYFYGLDTLPHEAYVFPDVFYVWNDYWLKRIGELSSLFAFHKNRLKIGGRASGYTAGIFIKRPKRTASDPLRVLVPYEVNADKKELYSYIEKIIACGNTQIVFKGRPDMSLSKQVASYLLEKDVADGHAESHVTMNDEDLSKIDVVVGVYTTLLDEMIEKGIPVGVFETSYPLYNNLADSNLAERIDVGDKDICTQLNGIRQLSEKELARRREVFLKDTGDIKETVQDIIHSLKL